MDPLAFPIFTLIFKLVVTQFDTLMSSVNGEFVRSISLIALVIETVYITHYGFLIAFELRTEGSDEANLTELLYHMIIVIVVLGLLNAPAGVTPLDAFMALRRLLMLGLIGDASGSVEPIGEQVHTALGALDTALSVGIMFDTVLRAANSTSVMLDTPQLKSTVVTLALVSDISPQISAGILLLLNELMVRLGIALFPLVFYGILYDVSRGFFLHVVGGDVFGIDTVVGVVSIDKSGDDGCRCVCSYIYWFSDYGFIGGQCVGGRCGYF
jgi:hypothetical protein